MFVGKHGQSISARRRPTRVESTRLYSREFRAWAQTAARWLDDVPERAKAYDDQLRAPSGTDVSQVVEEAFDRNAILLGLHGFGDRWFEPLLALGHELDLPIR